MNKVVNINLSGFIFSIDEAAYERLKNYIEGLRRHFAGTGGAAEIISDIEARIAELFELRLKDKGAVITLDDVEHVMALMGDPTQIGGEEEASSSQQSYNEQQTKQPRQQKLRRDSRNNMIGGVCSGMASYLGMDPFLIRALFLVALLGFGTGVLIYVILWIAIPEAKQGEIADSVKNQKRLFRNPDNKTIGGVCGGIASYLGIDAVWLRIGFLVALFFYGTGIMLYLILWIILPLAKTAAEKLQMAGEPVDVSNIERKVRDAFAPSSPQIKRGVDKAASATNRFFEMTGELLRYVFNVLGRFIGFIFVFTGIALLSVFAVCIWGNCGGIHIEELLKMLTASQPLYNMFLWGVMLFVSSFSLSIIIAGAKWLFKIPYRTKIINGILGFISLASVIIILISIVRYSTTVYESETMVQTLFRKVPTPRKLYIQSATTMPDSDLRLLKSDDGYYIKYYKNNGYLIANTKLLIRPSATDSMKLTVTRKSYGSSNEEAYNFAKAIPYKAELNDSLLLLDEALFIEEGERFAYQSVTATLMLPPGTIIKADNAMMNMIIRSNQFKQEKWNFGETFVVTKKGLKCIECEETEEEERKERIRIEIGKENNKDENNRKHSDDERRIEIKLASDEKIKTMETSQKNEDGTVTKTKVTKIGPVTITTENKDKN